MPELHPADPGSRSALSVPMWRWADYSGTRQSPNSQAHHRIYLRHLTANGKSAGHVT
jgi:hypothetical protein